VTIREQREALERERNAALEREREMHKMVQDVTAALKREGRGHIGCHLPLEGLLPLPLPLEGCIPLSLEGLPLLPYRHPPLQIRSKLSDFFPTSEVLRPRIRGAVEPFIQQDSENKLLVITFKHRLKILGNPDLTQQRDEAKEECSYFSCG
jgi:hypothetical protein